MFPGECMECFAYLILMSTLNQRLPTYAKDGCSVPATLCIILSGNKLAYT